MQEAVLRHPDWATALKKDLLLNGFGKVEMGLGLALAVGNQSAVGYNVCEIGTFDGAFTRKVRGAPIKSALVVRATVKLHCQCNAGDAIMSAIVPWHQCTTPNTHYQESIRFLVQVSVSTAVCRLPTSSAGTCMFSCSQADDNITVSGVSTHDSITWCQNFSESRSVFKLGDVSCRP